MSLQEKTEWITLRVTFKLSTCTRGLQWNTRNCPEVIFVIVFSTILIDVIDPVQLTCLFNLWPINPKGPKQKQKKTNFQVFVQLKCNMNPKFFFAFQLNLPVCAHEMDFLNSFCLGLCNWNFIQEMIYKLDFKYEVLFELTFYWSLFVFSIKTVLDSSIKWME